jgi:hypothetical protein
MNKKGLFFSIDVAIAFLLVILFVGGILFYLQQSQREIYSYQVLDAMGQDILRVLEVDGTLRQAVDLGTTVVLGQFLNELPASICGKISIFDSSQNEISSATKSGCSVDPDKVSVYRSFITTGANANYARLDISFVEVVG